MSEKDEELERINEKKMEEIMAAMKKEPEIATSEEKHPIVLTDSNFVSEVSKHKVMLVDFWAPWCGPCRMVGPIIEQLATEYSGRVSFGKLNVDENPRTSSMFRVQSIPTMLIFKDGKAVDGLLGAVPKSHIESKIRPYISGSKTGSFYG